MSGGVTRGLKPAVVEPDRRRPVWMALSELFLDTELSADDLRAIARVLAASGYSDDELELILRREVEPVVGGNLRSPAGEWAGFDAAWLAARILERQRSWRRFLPRRSAIGLVRGKWQELRQLLAVQRE